MKQLTIRSLCALALTATAFAPMLAPVPVGPGGVRAAVQDILRALDQADSKALQAAMIADRHGYEWREDGQETGGEAATAFDFFDVGHDGVAWAASAPNVLVESAKQRFDRGQGARPSSTIRRILADCPSSRCSYAVVEFDRIWGEGEDAIVVQMRATALFEHANTDEGQAEWRLMHWHASRRE